MAKPRFKKDMTGKKATKTECPGGTAKCNDRKASSLVIAAETLTRETPGAEAIAPLFGGAIPERHCCSEGGEDCCGEE